MVKGLLVGGVKDIVGIVFSDERFWFKISSLVEFLGFDDVLTLLDLLEVEVWIKLEWGMDWLFEMYLGLDGDENEFMYFSLRLKLSSWSL
jgi:hypothetical protein